ncbi:MAG: hypothetical protein ACSLEZ_09935, partial [Thiobacillus sp.]
KITLRMDVLRCKSQAMVEKEIAVCLLAYNLVRWAMAKAAALTDVCWNRSKSAFANSGDSL